MIRLLLLLLALAASPALAADIALCDPAHPSGVVDPADHRTSQPTENYEGNPDVLFNPDISAVAGVERRYWQCNRGANSLVPMSAGDQATWDAWVQAQADAASRGLGDRACLVQTQPVDVSGVSAVIPWDVERGPFHSRTYTHAANSPILQVEKPGTYLFSFTVCLSGGNNAYRADVSLRRDGSPMVWAGGQAKPGDSCASFAAPIVATAGEQFDLLVEQVSGGGTVLTVGNRATFCAALVQLRDSGP